MVTATCLLAVVVVAAGAGLCIYLPLWSTGLYPQLNVDVNQSQVVHRNSLVEINAETSSALKNGNQSLRGSRSVVVNARKRSRSNRWVRHFHLDESSHRAIPAARGWKYRIGPSSTIMLVMDYYHGEVAERLVEMTFETHTAPSNKRGKRFTRHNHFLAHG